MKPICIWITGRPGSGKTSLLHALWKQRPEFHDFDSDAVRYTLYPNLGYSHEDRWVNIRTLTSLASVAIRAGDATAVAAVSPLRAHRQHARERIVSAGGRFLEVQLFGRGRQMWEGTTYEDDFAAHRFNTNILDPFEVAGILKEQFLRRAPRQLFIGRWQPFHDGHEKIIRDALANGPVAIGVRETDIDGDNPYSAPHRVATIQHVFRHDDVEVFHCPDVSSIHIGRDVGYDIVQHDEVPGYRGSEMR